MTTRPEPEYLRKQANAVYLAAPEEVASDIARSLRQAADHIEALEETVAILSDDAAMAAIAEAESEQ